MNESPSISNMSSHQKVKFPLNLILLITNILIPSLKTEKLNNEAIQIENSILNVCFSF